MAGKKRLTGYTQNTMKNRQTGAGVYLKNYDIENDTFTTAVAAGKLIGATQGGKQNCPERIAIYVLVFGKIGET